MDLSGLKWPLIAVIVLGIGWLCSSSGTNYMVKKFTEASVGADPVKDASDEAMLSRIGSFMMKTFRYEKAFEVFSISITRYPEGKNTLYNKYRSVKCVEKMGDPKTAVAYLEELIGVNASSIDSRIPPNDNLTLRKEKLVEIFELQKR
ncbi:MAG: hypothetical protein QG656_885 [Candidatus Hydrogenedentes bacterium]|nr:hypothetical protein [Candidatus Hydrogenedentota bacterium]